MPEKMPLERFMENVKVWHFFAAALVLSGLCAVLRILPPDDVFMRYAPAAEAFARGDWQYAFHPRFGIFFTAFAGIPVFLFQCSGVAACQMASVLFFSLTVFPLYSLFQKILGKPTAFWGTLCYVFCSQLLRYAGEGLRDNGKSFSLALIALALVSMLKRSSWKDVFLFSIGGAMLTVLRGEGCLIALVCGITALFLLKDWKKSLAGIFLFFLLLAPQCMYNYRTIGYFVPELRHGMFLCDLGVPPADNAPVKMPEVSR